MEKFERMYHEQLEIVRTLKADAAIMRTNLRDKIAMAAMQGLISNPEYSVSKEDLAKYGSGDAVTAHYAYAQADAMMVVKGIENPEDLRRQREELISLLEESKEYIGGDWRDRRDSLLAKCKGAA